MVVLLLPVLPSSPPQSILGILPLCEHLSPPTSVASKASLLPRHSSCLGHWKWYPLPVPLTAPTEIAKEKDVNPPGAPGQLP